MGNELRRHDRRPIDYDFAVSWQDSRGDIRSLRARGLDLSDSGARIETAETIDADSYLHVRAEEHGVSGAALIRHLIRRGSKYLIGLELCGMREAAGWIDGDFVDYYELLQIAPAAELETIQRVYRMLIARYHPDNVHTGDAEKFLLLKRAYETLSNPRERVAYDHEYSRRQARPIAVFELKEFLCGVDAEANRRLGVLALLYGRRRMDPDKPGFSLLEFERLMTIPREHLMFTVWFLREKDYLRMGANSDYQITAAGAEFLECRVPSHRILHGLLGAPGDAIESKPAAAEAKAAGVQGGIHQVASRFL